MTALLFIAGLVLLVAGGELLIRGSVRLAARIGVSPLVVGLTIVAFGTSSPELAVSIQAGLGGQADIAVGNIVGSNIFNVLFVLGLSALIVPLIVSEQLIRLDVPIMVAVSVLLLLLALDGRLSQLECALLAAGVIAYIVLQIFVSRRTGGGGVDIPEGATQGHTGRVWVNLLLIVVGLSLLILGSRWLVQSAVAIAELFGISQLVIGLTVVAAGTSMPEVATSVIAGLRGQRDIAVGNVIGSNIFNILAVLGFSGLITPGGIQISAGALAIDLPIMVAAALLCLPIFLSHFSITRWEGLLFLVYYILYTTYIILDAANHHAVTGYRDVVVTVVLPLTLLTLIGFSLRSWQSRNGAIGGGGSVGGNGGVRGGSSGSSGSSGKSGQKSGQKSGRKSGRSGGSPL
ncbi:calcium/sodium antiporter [soil metagenome]